MCMCNQMLSTSTSIDVDVETANKRSELIFSCYCLVRAGTYMYNQIHNTIYFY